MVSCVHPVAILGALFCIICSLSMLVSDALVDQMVEANSSTGLVMALYVASIVSLYLPQFVEVRTLSMLIVLRALVVAKSMYLLYVSLGSNVPVFLGVWSWVVLCCLPEVRVVCYILLGPG